MTARQDQINAFLRHLESTSVLVFRAFMAAANSISSTVVLNAFADALARGDVEEAIRLLGLDAGAALSPIDEAVREGFKLGGAGAALGLRPNSFGARMLGRFSVRHQGAEAWLADNAARRVTGFLQELRGQMQDVLLDGMMRGQNPLNTARGLLGQLKKGATYRQGGTLLLTRARAATVAEVRFALGAGDLNGMRRYLQLKGRDPRFDKMVMRAIATKTKLPADKVATLVNHLADNYLRERAQVIARTEALAALNAGKAEAFRQATVAAGISDQHIHREWSSTGDQKVREDHRHLDGQKIVGINAVYRLPSGATIRRPGDPDAGAAQVARCRCMEYLEVDWFEGRA